MLFNHNINPELPAIDEYATIAETAIALEGKEEGTNIKPIANQTWIIDSEHERMSFNCKIAGLIFALAIFMGSCAHAIYLILLIIFPRIPLEDFTSGRGSLESEFAKPYEIACERNSILRELDGSPETEKWQIPELAIIYICFRHVRNTSLH